MKRSMIWLKSLALALLGIAFTGTPALAQFGPNLSGAGPVNRSMGGTAVAAPIDATGSTFWNPATSTEIQNSLQFGVELLQPHTDLDSSLPANAFGAGIPPVPLSGSSESETSVFPLPSAALVYRPCDSALTYGLGVFPVAGFGVNYHASTTNPILTPQPPNGLGFGALYSELQVLQIAPTLAVKINDRLSIGAGPTIDLAQVRLDPFFLGSPDDANGDGSFTYPDGGAKSRMQWGGGFQVGAYYTTESCWNFGASFKSEQWFEPFDFSTVNELGVPRNDQYGVELPWIGSIGTSYTGFDRWILAADFRYLDFENADGFAQQGFDATGAVRGIGFKSIFAMSLGAQYALTDNCSLRAGYSFNENPIEDDQSSFNIASPTVIMHAVYAGASHRVSETLTLSIAYAHGFENSVEGPLVTPFGSVPGSSVRNTLSVDTFMLGATMEL